MSYPIYLICGNKGSGKDTLADFMCQDRGIKISLADPIKRFVFTVFKVPYDTLWGPSENRDFIIQADELEGRYQPGSRGELGKYRDEWMKDLGLYPRQNMLDDWFYRHIAGRDVTVRHILQTLGTEFGRNANPNIWVDYALRTAHRVLVTSREYSCSLGVIDTIQKRYDFVVIPDGRFRNEVLAVLAKNGTAIKIVDPNAPPATGHVSETELDTIHDRWFEIHWTNDKSKGLDKLKDFAGEILWRAY
jgi:hypothetical protein